MTESPQWRFTAEAVRIFCDATGAISSIHRPANDRNPSESAIVPGMLTFLLLEDLAYELTSPPLRLDMTYVRPIPVGEAVTAEVRRSPVTAERWDVDVMLAGTVVASGSITSLP